MFTSHCAFLENVLPEIAEVQTSTQVQLPSHASGFLHSLECCAFPGKALLPRLWVVLLKNLGSNRPIGTIGATRINAGSWISCSYNLQQLIPHLTLPTANVPNNINNSFFTTLRPLASLQPSSQHILGTTDISRPSKLSTHSLGSSWASCFRWLEVSNLLSCLVSQIVPIKIGSPIANARTTTTQLLMCIYPHLCKWCLLYLLSENHVLDISGFFWGSKGFCCLPVAGSSHIAQPNSNNFRSKGDIHDTISSGVISYGHNPFLRQWHDFSRNDWNVCFLEQRLTKIDDGNCKSGLYILYI